MKKSKRKILSVKEPRLLQTKEVPLLRAKILKSQGGVCIICGLPPKRPCLDHHHKKRIKGTGRIRGVLCSNCNVLLAKLENNAVRCGVSTKRLPEVAQGIADYLKKPHYPFIHPSERPKEKRLKKVSYNKLVKSLKASKYKKQIPMYPKSEHLTVVLERLFVQQNITPEFYK